MPTPPLFDDCGEFDQAQPRQEYAQDVAIAFIPFGELISNRGTFRSSDPRVAPALNKLWAGAGRSRAKQRGAHRMLSVRLPSSRRTASNSRPSRSSSRRAFASTTPAGGSAGRAPTRRRNSTSSAPTALGLGLGTYLHERGAGPGIVTGHDFRLLLGGDQDGAHQRPGGGRLPGPRHRPGALADGVFRPVRPRCAVGRHGHRLAQREWLDGREDGLRTAPHLRAGRDEPPQGDCTFR